MGNNCANCTCHCSNKSTNSHNYRCMWDELGKYDEDEEDNDLWYDPEDLPEFNADNQQTLLKNQFFSKNIPEQFERYRWFVLTPSFLYIKNIYLQKPDLIMPLKFIKALFHLEKTGHNKNKKDEKENS